jgi:hypothetical protein
MNLILIEASVASEGNPKTTRVNLRRISSVSFVKRLFFDDLHFKKFDRQPLAKTNKRGSSTIRRSVTFSLNFGQNGAKQSSIK